MNRMGFSETIFLFLLALLIFGPKRLPEIARQVGKALSEFKRASNEFKAQLASEISQIELESQRQILPPAPEPKGSVATLPPATQGVDSVTSETALVEPKAPTKVAADA
ncbi:MAG TPA: twin-arginine translocase TatA/TatE family subunit [Terriglobales bacterium]|nr:twin-arginine translocase TatA/TatE family subunit [Terriglobales bacterium]